jgi:hypothetical protein
MPGAAGRGKRGLLLRPARPAAVGLIRRELQLDPKGPSAGFLLSPRPRSA